MKKFLLSLAAVAVAICAHADNKNLWAKALVSGSDGSATSSAVDLCTTSDGKVVMFALGGSKSSNHEITTYDDEQILVGGETAGTGTLGNTAIIKIDPATGKKLWAVTSQTGDMNTNGSALAPTNDGGVIVVLKERYSYGLPEHSPVFTDAKGEDLELTWNTDKNINAYSLVILKISSEGEIVAANLINLDTTPEAEASANYAKGTSDAAYGVAVTVDDSNNIYIGGRFQKTMVIYDVSGRLYVGPSPKHTTGWNGDPQKVIGDMFLVKYDADLNYLKHYTSNTTAAREQITNLLFNNGKIYFAGNFLPETPAQGESYATVSYGSCSFTPTNSFDGIIYGTFSTDLEPTMVNFVSGTAATDNKHTTQIKGLNIYDGKLYITGCVKGGFTYGDQSLDNTNTMLGGYILRFDATTGAWEKSKYDGNTIGAYYGVQKLGSDLYSYRYQLTKCTCLDKLDADLNTIETDLVTKCSPTAKAISTTAFGCTSTASNIVCLSRTKEANVDDTTFKFSGYTMILSAINPASSGSETISATDAFSVAASQDGITVTTASSTPVNVSNTAGQIIYSNTVDAGVTNISLPAGIYMVNNQKVLVK